MKDPDLWRSHVALGATTCLECSETAAKSARSDCHVWGAHPVKKCGALALFYEKEYNSDILYEGDYDRYA